MNQVVDLWPGQASEHAASVDLLVLGMTVLVVLLSAPIFALLIVFAMRYRRGREADRRHPRHRNVPLEVSWSVLPFVLLLGFFGWATVLFVQAREVPEGALGITVLAKQWMWKFSHPGGQREINDLHVPVDRPVSLTMTSEDVIHSLYVPALRIKQDVLPGRYTTLSFEANVPGTYTLTCAEFCGTDHSVMGGQLIVMTPGDYAVWLETNGGGATLAAEGEALYRSLGCSGCHEPGGPVRAPSLRGLFGSPVPLADGSVVVADRQYIRDSILMPRRQVAAGYQPVMPPFEGLIDENELMRLVAYIESLAAVAPGG